MKIMSLGTMIELTATLLARVCVFVDYSMFVVKRFRVQFSDAGEALA